MQTLLVALILAAVVGAVFLIARRGYWGYAQRLSDKAHGLSGETAIAKFFALFWGWADYNPKDWSSAPYKRASFDFFHNNPNALAVTREAGGLGTTLSHRDRLVASLGSEGLFNEI